MKIMTTRAVAVSLVAGTVATLMAVSPAQAASARPRVHAVGVGSNPAAVAIKAKAGKVFVVNDGSVSVVDLATRRQVDEFGTGGYHGQNGLALVHGARGYVTNGASKNVVIFSTRRDRVSGSIPVGTGATAIATSPSPRGQVAYVGYATRSHLTLISTASNKVVGNTHLPAGAATIRTTPNGRRVWVGTTNPGQIAVVNVVTRKVVRKINAAKSGPVTSIAFAPNGRRAYVAGLAGVSVVNVKSGRTVKFLPILRLFTSPSPNMGAIAVARGGRYVLVENSTFPDQPQRGQVTAVDTRTFKVAWRVRTGYEPLDLAVDKTSNVAFAPNYADDTLSYFRVPR